MAWLRRHVFTIVAVAAAMAIGIALGAGPLQGAEDSTSPGESAAQTRALRDQVTALQQSQVFDESLSQASGSSLLKGRLQGSAVAVFVLPGVSTRTVKGIQSAVSSAGGLISLTTHLDPDLIDTAHRTYVQTVAASSMAKLKDLPTGRNADPYVQISALVARAYVGPADALPLDHEAVNIDSELQGAKLVKLEAEAQRRGSLVVVLAPGDHGSDPVVTAAHSIEVNLIRALATAGDAALVATPPQGSDPGGLLDALAAAPGIGKLPLSTLNVVGSNPAQIAAVYALSAAASGKAGSFGVDGSQVRLPPGLAATGT